jgi:hypothetical protein
MLIHEIFTLTVGTLVQLPVRLNSPEHHDTAVSWLNDLVHVELHISKGFAVL